MRGLLLVNLGTPDSPKVKDVRKYLMEFLSDPLVIDTHPIVRWLIVHFIIAPFRSRSSSLLYKKLWTDRGSPLLFHGIDLKFQISRLLGTDWKVAFGMRYGNPSIESALKTVLNTKDLTVFLLFPQYSLAAFESAKVKVNEELLKLGYAGKVNFVNPYFDHPAFIKVFSDLARPFVGKFKKVFFTFHGLPVRHCRKSSPQSELCTKSESCCDSIRDDNKNCYRAQCFYTARAMAKELNLQNFEVVFQSRFGRDPYIQPFADQRLFEVAQEGVDSVLYISPSFTADCLETVEEVGTGFKSEFIKRGGKDLHLVESLNSSPEWSKAILEICNIQIP